MEKKRQAFNYNLLAAIISRSPTSGRMRYAPTVYGEKQDIKRNDPSPYPQRTKGKYVGAYRIRPPHEQIWPTKELFIMKLPGKTLPGSRGTFPQAGKPCSVPGEHFPGWEKLARFPRNIFPDGKTLLGFRGTFPRAGKPCSVPGEHFPGRENLARFQGNIFPSGKTLLGFRGTFSRVGKPCSVPGEHFPGREIPRCVLRQAFNDSMLVAVISCSPTSGRMRYAPTVFGEILTRNDTIHHRIRNKSMVNM